MFQKIRNIWMKFSGEQKRKDRYAAEIFARIASTGCIVNDDSVVDGIRFGDLKKRR